MKKTILLLEDDRQLNETIQQFLEYHGYKVLSAYDGLSAQEIAYEKHIDLMLLDVKVPHQNGFAFLKTLRDKKITTPAIFITSLNSVDDVSKGFANGCEDYIRKPFALKELLVRIESLLKRHYGTNNETLVLGNDIIFDLKALSLTKENKPIALKTKELKLLRFFLRRPNELLIYEEIFNAVWEFQEEPSTASLRTYIKSLRSAIGKDRIVTVKNIGYRFV